MPGFLTRQSSISSRTGIVANDPHGTVLASTRAERLKMLFAAASLGIGECPSWTIQALEAEERADRELYAEERSRSC
jgi:hypothetical protein